MSVTVSDVKTYYDIAKEAGLAIAFLLGMEGTYATFRNRNIDRMMASWTATVALVEACEQPGCDMQIYFKTFVVRCREEFDTCVRTSRFGML